MESFTGLSQVAMSDGTGSLLGNERPPLSRAHDNTQVSLRNAGFLSLSLSRRQTTAKQTTHRVLTDQIAKTLSLLHFKLKFLQKFDRDSEETLRKLGTALNEVETLVYGQTSHQRAPQIQFSKTLVCVSGVGANFTFLFLLIQQIVSNSKMKSQRDRSACSTATKPAHFPLVQS